MSRDDASTTNTSSSYFVIRWPLAFFGIPYTDISEGVMGRDDARIITVCDKCFMACCWHGEFMCDESKEAGTVEKTVKELNQLNLEHPSHYSRKKIEEVCGV